MINDDVRSRARIRPMSSVRPFATEPTSMSICVACSTCAEFTTYRNMGDTYGYVIQFSETTSSSAYCPKGDTLIKNQTIFMLVLQFDLFMEVRWPVFSYRVTNLRLNHRDVSVTINLLVRGPGRFRRSLLSPKRTSSRLLGSLCSNQRIVEREICRPF